jgi:hypothetical protein
MAGRLASFKGPSTPTSSPVRAPPSKSPKASKNARSPAAAAPSTPVESTYHRKLRAGLRELQACARTWDALVQHDGLRAASALVDARTDLECVPRRRPLASFMAERARTVTR